MEKKYVVPLKEAISGVLHGGVGTFRILIDEQSSGAKNFSLLVNTTQAGAKGAEHTHDVEHCWYILSGKGTMYIDGKAYRIEPQTAIYTPAHVLHRMDADSDADLTYIVIYAPPGPEQELKQKGAHAFESK
jgi:mannose-6-phosphate isomerase-like protein (cupin superfamily)